MSLPVLIGGAIAVPVVAVAVIILLAKLMVWLPARPKLWGVTGLLLGFMLIGITLWEAAGLPGLGDFVMFGLGGAFIVDGAFTMWRGKPILVG